ncbi:hypothetical protein AWL63_23945 (plasmid) [Sphingomonas panacis]|uniref:YCII-related domain-containing protein n=2 Tax=Sphingomonas panacis TaxID=1560345 RepID=A0A1B3ZIF6_9SPHN|nr:hypothetical protein AWL63_23945 [Sphingomonas panacis]
MEQVRLNNRPAHLEYIKGSGSSIVAAGPLIGPDGHAVGGFFLLDVANLAAAEDWAAKDPFRALELYGSVEIQEWKYVFGSGLEPRP